MRHAAAPGKRLLRRNRPRATFLPNAVRILGTPRSSAPHATMSQTDPRGKTLMSLALRCPNPSCGFQTAAPDDYAGKSVRCPQCRTKFKVSVHVEPTVPNATPETKKPSGPSPTTATYPGTLTKLGRFEIRKKL